uniref:Uncharacterized protein n=1 Tax=Oryza rufipogon TaxID=4529 RepID=A0A0E0QM48_ORYRU
MGVLNYDGPATCGPASLGTPGPGSPSGATVLFQNLSDQMRFSSLAQHVPVHKETEHHLPDQKMFCLPQCQEKCLDLSVQKAFQKKFVERPGGKTMPGSEDQTHAPHDGAIVQWKPSPEHPFPAGKDTHAVHRHASTLDTSGMIMDFSWYNFTTGAPAPVLSPAMTARAQVCWLKS